MSNKPTSKRKILFYYGTMDTGGAERVLINILNFLDRSKYKIDLALISDQGATLKFIPKDINIIPLWRKNSILYSLEYRLSLWFGIDYFLRRHINKKLPYDYDVEISFLEGMPLKLQTLKNNSTKKINWVHIDLNKFRYASSFFFKDKENIAYHKMDKVICVSNDCKKAFLYRFPDLKDKVNVIYNAIDKNTITKKSNEFSVTNETFTVISVCRLAKQKGIERIIRVAKMFKESNINIHFQIIGIGELYEPLLRLSNLYEVSDIVHFLGYKENPYPFIKAADIMLCSSIAEGFCLSMCESMCIGTPVVSTKTAGPCEILLNNEYGLLCDHDDKSIFLSVKKLYDSHWLRTQYALRAKKRIEIFDTFSIKNQIEDLFDNI